MVMKVDAEANQVTNKDTIVTVISLLLFFPTPVTHLFIVSFVVAAVIFVFDISYSPSLGIKIFAGQGREQYFVEGFIVAAWTVGCGLAGLILHQSNKAPFAIVRHVLVILAMRYR